MARHQRVVEVEVVLVDDEHAVLEITTEELSPRATTTVRRRHPGGRATVQHAGVRVAEHHGLVRVGERRWAAPTDDQAARRPS